MPNVNVLKDTELFKELTAKRQVAREPSERTRERLEFFQMLDQMLEKEVDAEILQWVFDVSEMSNAQRLTLRNRMKSWARKRGYHVDFYRVRKHESHSYLPVQLERIE